MLIKRNQFNLTDLEEKELVDVVTQIWQDGCSVSKLTIAGNCLDAYKQNFTTEIAEEDSWLQDLRVYLPVTSTAVDSLVAVHLNTIFPNNRYLRILTELTGEFLTDVILQNFADVGFKKTTRANGKQAGIVGDTFTLLNRRGNYVDVKSVSLHDIRIYPLSKDLSKTNKVFMLRKCAYDLATSPSAEYIAENVAKIKKGADKTGHDKNGTVETYEGNEYRRSENQVIGLGHVLLEAHLPIMEFKSGSSRIAKNIIVTIDKRSRILLRYYEPQEEENYESDIIHTPWSDTLEGEFWGTGIVQPVLSLQYFMNSIMMNELAAGYLSNFGGIMYNADDPNTQQYTQFWERRPGAKWPISAQSNIQPIPLDSKSRFAYEFLPYIQQFLVEQTNAQQAVTGANSPVKFATQANIQFQASNGRVASTASHWDESYIQECAYRTLKMKHNMWFRVVGIDPFTGQPKRVPNIQAIAWDMRKVGWDDQKIYSKLFGNPYFLPKLGIPIEFTDIQVIGTKTTLDRAEKLDRFTNTINGALNTPEMQYYKWNKVAEKRAELADIGDPQDVLFTPEEMEQLQMQQMQQQAGQQQGMIPGQMQPQGSLGLNFNEPGLLSSGAIAA
ncbi:MAG: hypothetical protein A3F80_01255 [Candidatus Melainabacteria bacterium RIFCSPLOWO2_12_FULL_35_11]|nr:MAG: hypothetical protein A3F80_01255 [Candidatus Melainabacteria bacterium RIFCSPLOWO2_12_FULL_35_11]